MNKTLIVTPVLPSTTGIAEFTHKTFEKNAEFVVISPDTTQRSFLELFTRADIKEVVFSLGNSNHNIGTVNLLKLLRNFPAKVKKIIIHVHDPVVWNLALEMEKLGDSNPFDYYADINDLGIESVTGVKGDIPTCQYRAFSEKGCAGWAYLIRDLNVYSFVTHSRAAKDIVQRDIKMAGRSNILIEELFHPVFDFEKVETLRSNIQKKFDIGVFGVLDDGGKMTNKAIHCIEDLIRQRKIRNAVFCGYNAKKYAYEKKIINNPHYTFVEDVGAEEFVSILSSTKIALQFRSQNTGESSGVVPLLLKYGVIPIVSNLGAFSEYPDDIVFKIDNDNINLAVNNALKKIKNIRYGVRNKSIDKYIKENNPALFVEKFLRHIQFSRSYNGFDNLY